MSSGSVCSSPARSCCNAFKPSSISTRWRSKMRERLINTPSWSSTATRCSSWRGRHRSWILARGEDYILYAILDFIVDNYVPVVETVQGEVDELEDGVLHRTLQQAEVDRLYMLRRELLRLRKAVVPLVDVCHRLEHAEALPIDREMQPLFRDVTDHIQRVQEDIDSLREVLAFAFEASLMAGQAQQNAITRRLAAWAAILAVPTAVAGIYGMNFEHMPELKWTYGYYVVVGGILSVCTLLYVRFRHYGWL